MFSRKTTVRAAAILGGAALMGLTLVGCSSSGGSGDTIRLMAGGNDPVNTKFANTIAPRVPQGEPVDHGQGRHSSQAEPTVTT